MIIIQNEFLTAVVSEQGAEVQQLTDKATGKEYYWNGDENYWGGHSPILFPITGGLWDRQTLINSKPYAIPKHGFVKDEQWNLKEQTSNSVCFIYRDEKKHFDVFPYEDYELHVRYTLEGRSLKTDLQVVNCGKQPIHFQMGGHPGILLPEWDEHNSIDGYLRLEGKVESIVRASTQGCIEVKSEEDLVRDPLGHIISCQDNLKRYPVPMLDGLVPLCVDTFSNEALIFDEQVTAVTVLDIHKAPVARISSSAPVWLFWSQQGQHCPFICCEPWYGLPDLQGFDGAIEQRPYIQTAQAGETWSGGYEVETF